LLVLDNINYIILLIIGENRGEVNQRFEVWRLALEGKGLGSLLRK